MKPKEAQEAAKSLVGLVLLTLLIVVAGSLAWLLGPFGPSINDLTAKWIVTVVDFVAIAVILFVCIAVYVTQTDTGFVIYDWIEAVQDNIADRFTKQETQPDA